jgi:hypothetical protein
VPSTHRTDEIGFGLLLTPNLVQIAETPEQYQARQIKRTKEGKNQAPHPNNKYNCLLSQVLYSGMLPTPNSFDWNTAQTKEKYQERKDMQKENGVNLQYSLRQMTMDINPTGTTSQLSPQFVLEMMGFPTDWTELPFLNGETNQ